MSDKTTTRSDSATTVSATAVSKRRSPLSLKVVLVVGLALVLLGGAAWLYQLSAGFLQTASMNNAFPWGLGIGIFAFLVGFAAGGQLLCSYSVLVKRAHLRRYAPFCAAIAFAAALAASIAVLADLGNLGNVFAMVLGPHLTSPLVWDMVALTVFILVALVNFVVLALPIWVRSNTRTGNWLLKRIRPERADGVTRRLAPALAIIGIIAAIALQVVEGLIFSLQAAHVWWHSPLLPVDFIAVAGICGSALLLLVIALTTKRSPVEEDEAAVRHVGRFLVFSLELHFIIVAIEIISLFISNTPADKEVLSVLFGDYAVLYAIELILPLAALVIVGSPKLRTLRGALIAAPILTIIGILAHRLMLLYGAYTVPSLIFTEFGESWGYPISTGFGALGDPTFAATTAYIPAPIEIGVALLPLGIAVLVCALLLSLSGSEPARDQAQRETPPL